MIEKMKNSVLIVDDEHLNMIALTNILSSDYSVFAVKDGQDAIEYAEEFVPDVILLDIMMPEMDGYAVIAALKNSEKTKNIPVIFITGLIEPADEEKGLSMGAADYISKPFSPIIVKLRVQNQIKIINQTRLIIEKETAEKSSRARREFLSRMSHEMRTPMNAIMGLIALSKKMAEIDKRDSMLDKMSSSADHLMRLIDDVLDISDIEDKKLQLSLAAFGFGDMIRKIINKINPEIRAKQQTLTTDIDPSIPDIIIGDERRLAQIILSLLSNACKFTPELGSTQINAFVRGVEAELLILQIEVVDNGIGISKEQCEGIFMSFEQADGGIDRKLGGAGLELAISKHIVELMDGEIWVESDLGKGSIFAFTVKMQLKAPEIKDDSPISLEGKRLLLAEDVEINREIVMSMLEDTGLEIICAENGREAVDLYQAASDPFDIILMDINMPEMDGLEATSRIRALATPDKAQIPIIAMTANVLMSEVETYLAKGMTDHIGKPVDFDKMLSKLYRYLK